MSILTKIRGKSAIACVLLAIALSFALSAIALADDVSSVDAADNATSSVSADSAASSGSLVAGGTEASADAQPADGAQQEVQAEEPVPFTGKGTFFITASASKKQTIGMKDSDRTNNAKVVVSKKKNTNLLRFKLVSAGKGLYYIRNVATGRQLEAFIRSEGKGSAVMCTATKEKCQKWKIEKYSDGTVAFTNPASGLRLQMAGGAKGKAKIGANVILRKPSDSPAQRFRLVKTKRNKSEAIKLKVPCYLQNPQLPTGCESVALTNTLRYWGFKLQKTTIASRWLPYGDSGVYNFIGNPFDSSGWIICAPGLANTAHRFLMSKGSDLDVEALHGVKMKDLRTYLAQGCPVIVWTTIGMTSPGAVAEYKSGYMLRHNTHTVVLAGYSPKKKAYLVADSLAGTVWRDAKRFESLYNQMGKQAVVISD